jgi:ABC-type phosphate transport system substrate-binding protein
LKHLIIIGLIFLHLVARAQNEPLVVITNKKGAPEEMKMTELRSIMKGERQRWKDGNKIKIALMKPSTQTGISTCKKIYDKDGDEVKKFWLGLVFQGKADAPVFFNSEAELKTFVSENEGAIGIVEIFVNTPDIKMVSIDGKREF